MCLPSACESVICLLVLSSVRCRVSNYHVSGALRRDVERFRDQVCSLPLRGEPKGRSSFSQKKGSHCIHLSSRSHICRLEAATPCDPATRSCCGSSLPPPLTISRRRHARPRDDRARSPVRACVRPPVAWPGPCCGEQEPAQRPAMELDSSCCFSCTTCPCQYAHVSMTPACIMLSQC